MRELQFSVFVLLILLALTPSAGAVQLFDKENRSDIEALEQMKAKLTEAIRSKSDGALWQKTFFGKNFITLESPPNAIPWVQKDQRGVPYFPDQENVSRKTPLIEAYKNMLAPGGGGKEICIAGSCKVLVLSEGYKAALDIIDQQIKNAGHFNYCQVTDYKWGRDGTCNPGIHEVFVDGIRTLHDCMLSNDEIDSKGSQPSCYYTNSIETGRCRFEIVQNSRTGDFEYSYSYKKTMGMSDTLSGEREKAFQALITDPKCQ